MMNNAWRTLAAVGLVSAFAFMGGCVVGSSDDDSTGGSSGSGGGGSGGTGGGATGGAGGSTGGTGGATGGAGGSGGSAGFECEPATGTVPGTPGSCKASSTDACEVCQETKCCAELSACKSTDPGNPCWNGGKADEGEIFCFQECYTKKLAAAADPTVAKGECANECATAKCSTIAGATNDLITCLDTNCLKDCFE